MLSPTAVSSPHSSSAFLCVTPGLKAADFLNLQDPEFWVDLANGWHWQEIGGREGETNGAPSLARATGPKGQPLPRVVSNGSG